MTREQTEKILRVGVLLSSERDLNRLLEQILSSVMELTNCDAGTLYLLDGDALRFRIMRNDTLKTYAGGNGEEPDLPPVPLSKENVCALSLLEGRTIRIDDVYKSTECDFSGAAHYDAITGYHTQSMLVVPMRNREGEWLGVLQLINALDENGRVCGFQEDMALMLESVASQAAITIQNVRYIRDIRALFQSFVKVLSSAIDERTPYNASHTRHMAAYGERFLDYLNARAAENAEPAPFDKAHREEFIMSVWLHDVGKLVTPLEVMNKEARLLPEQKAAFLHRMEVIRLRAEIEALSGKLTPSERDGRIEATRCAEALIERVNTAGFLPDERLAEIDALAAKTYVDGDGVTRRWLTEDEHAMLSIRKGTLSNAEREVMESHVVVTDKLLSQIRFSRDLSHVREWAAAHHEQLNGTGYPRHLRGEEIPTEVRILTILDIFDALTADDRPYKPGMPVGRALDILDAMANKEGKLDPALTKLFIESRCWENAAGENA